MKFVIVNDDFSFDMGGIYRYIKDTDRNIKNIPY